MQCSIAHLEGVCPLARGVDIVHEMHPNKRTGGVTTCNSGMEWFVVVCIATNRFDQYRKSIKRAIYSSRQFLDGGCALFTVRKKNISKLVVQKHRVVLCVEKNNNDFKSG